VKELIPLFRLLTQLLLLIPFSGWSQIDAGSPDLGSDGSPSVYLQTDYSQWATGTQLVKSDWKNQMYTSDIPITLDHKAQINTTVTAKGDHLEIMIPAFECCYFKTRFRGRYFAVNGFDEAWAYVSYKIDAESIGLGGKMGLELSGNNNSGAFISPTTNGSHSNIWMWHQQGNRKDDSDTGSNPNKSRDSTQFELKSYRYNATSPAGIASRQFLKDLGTNDRILFDNGVWYDFIIHYKLNTPGLSDGESEIWYKRNDASIWTKVQDIKNKNFRGSSTNSIHRIELHYFPGGNDSTKYRGLTDRYFNVSDILITSDSVAPPVRNLTNTARRL
jgi:hypothetical protein